MRRIRAMQWVMQGAVLAGLAACAGSDTTTMTSEAAAALDTAQCSYQSDHAAADACFQAFQACITAAGADEAACRATLTACLPPPPPGRGPHGPPPGDFDGGRPPPPPDFDGGLPPPPPGGPHGGGGCDGMGPPPVGEGPRGPGGPGGGPLVQPDPVAVQACHDALDACLAATPGDASCFQTEHDCMHAAFDAAFQALCSSNTCDPATDADCARLVQRCTEGVGGRPEAFDGGTCP